jgi:hypothetical protein
VAEHKIEGIYDQEPLALAVNDFLESIQFARMLLSNGEFSLKVLAALEAGDNRCAPGERKPWSKTSQAAIPFMSRKVIFSSS